MKEVHGVSDARKRTAVTKDEQAVLVSDGDGEVLLSLGSSSYPAGLSPEMARFIAGALTASADRIESDQSGGE